MSKFVQKFGQGSPLQQGLAQTGTEIAQKVGQTEPVETSEGRLVGPGGHWRSELYAVKKSVFEDSCRRLKVFPVIDSFSLKFSRLCSRHWGPDSDECRDAFGQCWAHSSIPGHVLWCNPPFSMLDSVVNKLHLDHGHALLVMPVWEDKDFYKKACWMTLRKVPFPKGSLVFNLDGRPAGPIR